MEEAAEDFLKQYAKKKWWHHEDSGGLRTILSEE